MKCLMLGMGMLLLAASPLAGAASGSWSSASYGGTLTHGKQRLKSRPVQSTGALPQHASAETLQWQIKMDGPAPQGLRLQFCSVSRCVPLPAQQGEITLPVGFPAAGPFHFEYFSIRRGPLQPPLTVLSNQVTIGYQVKR
ncbi:flagellar protein FlhE [Pantoea sp. NPDC088449]|uniref:flagellar protein FlhE n=1 Tax=Pantoea sp. NPDC088449 TaxID=3364392 RepID=UPI0037F26085